MVTYFSCNRRWFRFKAFCFSKYLYVTCFLFLQNFENHNCANILFSRLTLRRISFKKKLFCNLHNDFGILLTFFIKRFLHAQKIVIFIVVYWKACGVPWKWNTTVNICLFSCFNLTFYVRQQQWALQKPETLQLGGNKG